MDRRGDRKEDEQLAGDRGNHDPRLVPPAESPAQKQHSDHGDCDGCLGVGHPAAELSDGVPQAASVASQPVVHPAVAVVQEAGADQVRHGQAEDGEQRPQGDGSADQSDRHDGAVAYGFGPAGQRGTGLTRTSRAEVGGPEVGGHRVRLRPGGSGLRRARRHRRR